MLLNVNIHTETSSLCVCSIAPWHCGRKLLLGTQKPPHPFLTQGLFMKQMLIGSLACLAMASAFANEPTQKDAIAMTERGAAFIKAHGKEELMKKLAAKDPEFVQGELYVDMRDLKTGIVLAHPINPSIVGKDLTDVPDPSGKKYRREIIELAAKSGKGWVDYMYKNPVSGKIEPKTTYILRVGDVVLEAGIYKN
jgi:signal transduction histidine kinase